MKSLPFATETDLERRLVSDPDWQTGAAWGRPRNGHPEGAVKWHIAEVLGHLDELDLNPGDRTRLRLAAIIHDTFKYRVDQSERRIPPNEHGYQAALWAREYLADDPDLLALIELHDEGYRAWRAAREGDEAQSNRRLAVIARRLGTALPLFTSFYWADNCSGAKERSQIDWFVGKMRERGLDLDAPRQRIAA